jgi:inosose dehydratase
MPTTRRQFLETTLGVAATAALASPAASPYRIGITTNTRGGWEDDVFLSFREAREVGYRNVESFMHYFTGYMDKPQELQKKIDEIGVRFVTISNDGTIDTHFEDPAHHEKIIEQHIQLVRFIKKFGCDHLKINSGARRDSGTTPEDLKHIAVVLDEIGKRTNAEGLKFAIHAHMWSQIENRRETEFIMEHTDPKQVWFVLDTGHITMAGMDPVALAKQLGYRIIEFHLKDVKPEHRGGARQRVVHHEPMTNPVFFPLGEGGVDFKGLMAHLEKTAWRGWLTIELDSSPFKPPKESARISLKYMEDKLGLSVT